MEQLEVQAHAVRLQAGEVTYSIRLTNRTDVEFGGVILEAGIPPGGQVIEILPSPPGVLVEQGRRSVRWRIDKLPAQRIVAPFAFRVAVADGVGTTRALVRWKRPTAGQASHRLDEVQDASLTSVTSSLGAGPLTDIPQTGLRYLVPLGDRGAVTIQRLSAAPGDVPKGHALLAAYDIKQEKPGSLVLVAPLLNPGVPHGLVRVFMSDAGGTLQEQPLMGTVTGDGLHAIFAADAAGAYVLAMDELRLGSAFADIHRTKVESLVQQAMEGLIEVLALQGRIDEFLDILSSLRTEGGGGDQQNCDVLCQFLGWVCGFSDCETTQGGDPADTSTSCTFFEDGSGVCETTNDVACGGGDSTTAIAPSGAETTYCENGTLIECDPDEPVEECELGEWETHPEDFAPVPGPCPFLVCMFDAASGELFPLDQVVGLAPTLSDLLTRDRGNATRVPPALSDEPPPGAGELSAAGLRAVLITVGNEVLFQVPEGQGLQLSVMTVRPK
jgi:hypothetical protein